MLTTQWRFMCELTQGLKVKEAPGLLFTGDQNAHEIAVEVCRNGQRENLTGTDVNGYFIRAGGDTVLLRGVCEGNEARMRLDASCYGTPGAFALVMKAVRDGVTLTLLALSGQVRCASTEAVADPGEILPSIDELLAQVTAMEAATEEANEAAQRAGKTAEEVEGKLLRGELTGRGLTVLGYFATQSALQTGVQEPAAGDAYGVGTQAPYDIYIWDGQGKRWVNNGRLQGAGLPGGGKAGQVLVKNSNENLDTGWKNLLDMIYPVGSVYTSVKGENPETLLGGKWQRLKDCFLWAGGDGDVLGAIGGEKEHQLTQAELPTISGMLTGGSGTGSSGYGIFRGAGGAFKPCDMQGNEGVSAAYAPDHADASAWVNGVEAYQGAKMEFGANAAHNNMPPYRVVWMWMRTA